MEPSLTDRVEALERTTRDLETLPAKVDAIANELKALREEMRAGDQSLREEIRAGDESLRVEIRAGDEATRTEMRTGFATLRQEIKDGDEETRRYMRVLHEDVIQRLATIGEAKPRKRK